MKCQRFERERFSMVGELFEDRVGGLDSLFVLLELILGLCSVSSTSRGS